MMTDLEKKAIDFLRRNSFFETRRVNSRLETTRKEPSAKETFILVSKEYLEEIDRLNKLILDKQKTIDLLFSSIHSLEVQNAELKNELEILKIFQK